MQRFAQVSRVGFASGMITLGAIGLVFRDFALVWGQLPGWVPWQTALACICAIVALGAGVALIVRRTAPWASLVLFVYVAVWWLLLRVPAVFTAPLTEVSWLRLGMLGLLLSGAWTVFADLGGRPFLGGERGMLLARVLFALSLIPIGISHYAYSAAGVGLVPSWLPFRIGWTYFTGACHIAAGLGVLFGVLPKLAAELEAVMLGIFTILVWVPRVITAPGTRTNWTELWISAALTAAVAVVAAHIPRQSREVG